MKNNIVFSFKRFEFRPNIGKFPIWGGMEREAPPGSLAANRLFLLRNTRFEDTEILARKGQEKLNDTAVDGAISAIFDTTVEDQASQKLWGFGSR